MRTKRVMAVAVALLLASTAACSVSTGSASSDSDSTGSFNDPGSCTVVELSVSPEKIDLMNALAQSFNATKAQADGKCVFVRPQKVSSGAAATALYTTWDEDALGHKPVIWSPAGSIWGKLVDFKLGQSGGKAIVGDGQSFMLTPLVIAMPQPMAQAIGYPGKAIGWSDILTLAKDQSGWTSFGHPEWGPFKLGKTNPGFSTSGLNELVAQADAAAGKTSGLSLEDLDRPDVEAFAEGVESAVVHYGDTTLTFLNNMYKADQRGTALSYVSAVAVEEKSVIDYNQGNPDGILSPGEVPRAPRIPLVAIYPKEGTLFSDSPMFVLDAPWVSQPQKDGAKLFETFVQRPDNQKQVLQYHFRPGNPAVAVADPITKANGVDPDQPQTLLEVPAPEVVGKLLDKWKEQRKKAKVTLVLDVSGSMGDPADPNDESIGSKLDLAKQAVTDSLDQLSDDDQVAFDIFSTDLGDQGNQQLLQLLPFGRVGDVREKLRTFVQGLFPENATPLYDVTQQAYQAAIDAYDPSRINAVVLLTDGKNDDGNTDDDQQQLQRLISSLRSGNEGQASKPVRVFTIGYGKDADANVLKSIAEAATSGYYPATDPRTIDTVLTNVLSNF